MTRTFLVALSIALLSAGCGGRANSTSIGQAAKPWTWTQIAATLTPALDSGSPNPCQRGAPSCIEAVLAEMRRRESRLAAHCDHRALFAAMYETTTAAISAAARARRFKHPAAMRHFDAWFARLYFTSFDAWQAGRLADVPAAWQIAFSANTERSVTGLGDLLLAMNAHISRDLPTVVAELTPKPTTTIDPDYALVSRIIEQISAPALDQIAEHFDPTARTAEIPLQLGGRLAFGQLVALWRTQSWARGIALRDAAPSARPAIQRHIETSAAARAAAILAATSYLPLIQSSASRDVYCQAHHG